MMCRIPFLTAVAAVASVTLAASSVRAADDKAAPEAREYVLTVEGMT